MNRQFTVEQIKAYAAQFREGDAIWVGGEWREVVKNVRYGDSRMTAHVDSNNRVINAGREGFYGEGPFAGYWRGFTKDLVRTPYRVTTLEDYELQGGEKVVRLGETINHLTFGKVYLVDFNRKYINDWGHYLTAKDSLWAVIPRYEQVKNLEKTTITEKVNEVVASKMKKEKEDDEVDRPASSHYHIDNNGNDVWKFADDNLSDERVKGFHQINAIKYISRYEKKHDTKEKRIEDLEKAKASIDKLIELEELK